MQALITGASSGIGASFARVLSELGYDLILVARRKTNLNELKKELKTKVKVVPLDLSDMDNVEYLCEQLSSEDIDIVINNAGFGLFGNFYETDMEREMKMIDLNIKAVHYITKKFLIKFKEKDSGYILNVASSAAFMAGPKLSTYYATKNYVARLTEAIYEELRRENSNVHVSALCPGPVDTEFNKVAHGEFKTKSLTPDYVARYAINKMFKNKLLIVPGFKIKCAVFATRIFPKKFLLKINYNIQDAKTK